MLEMRLTADLREIERSLNSIQRQQLPFATALSLTRTAQFVERKIVEEMPRVFDRPTRYTLKSTWVDPARKDRLWAMVRIKDDPLSAGGFQRILPIRYLAPEIHGGGRSHKAFEKMLIHAGKMPPYLYAVPTRYARRDAYGNVPGSEINRILSDLRAQFDVAQNVTAASLRRRLRSRTRRAAIYFSTWPPSPATAHLKPGIYQRTASGSGHQIRPVFLFVRRPRYRVRLHFFAIAEQTARMRWPTEFALAMRHAMRTAR